MAFEPMKLEHEGAEVRAGRIVAFGLGFVAFAAVLIGVLAVFYQTSVPTGRVAAAFKPFPAPRLQPNPTQDYADFHRAQLDQLSGTRFVDRKANLLHVPIERAMLYVAGKGAAAYDPPTPPPNMPSTPADGEARAKPSPSVAPYGHHP